VASVDELVSMFARASKRWQGHYEKLPKVDSVTGAEWQMKISGGLRWLWLAESTQTILSCLAGFSCDVLTSRHGTTPDDRQAVFRADQEAQIAMIKGRA